jgi:hypothetical protein
MWEVINCCVIFYAMIIESEIKNPPMDDHPYDGHGHFAQLDNELAADLQIFASCMQKSAMQILSCVVSN